MRATGVIARFLTLLDVALILLGIFLLAIAQAQLRVPERKLSGAIASRFVYLYAGTQGDENGKCYQLSPEGRVMGEVRTDVPDDVQQLLKQANPGQESGNRVVLLVISPLGFDTRWPPSRLAEMEKVWGVKVVPLYDLNLAKIR